MIYNLFYFSSVFANIASFKDAKSRLRLYYVLLASMFIFSTFRWNVGCDWGSYLRHAQAYGASSYAEAASRSEPLYWLLVSFLYRMELHYPSINIVAGIIFFAGLHVIAKRQPDRLLYLTLLFPILTTNIAMAATRQAIAIGLICFAYNAFSDRKLTRFVVFILIASGVHLSAIVFLAFSPFVRSHAINRNRIIGFGVLSLPILYVMATSSALQGYTETYVGTGIDAVGAPFRALAVSATGLLFIFFLRNRWRVYSPTDYNLVLLMSLLMIVILPTTFYSSVIGDRFGYYANPVQAIILAKLYLFFPKNAWTMFLGPLSVLGIMLVGWTQFSWIFLRCYANYSLWTWY